MQLTEKTQGCFWNGPELGERMSRKATEFQKKEMSRMYRGKESFKPLNTGWTDNFEFAFAHKDQLCSPFKKRVHDPAAPTTLTTSPTTRRSGRKQAC